MSRRSLLWRIAIVFGIAWLSTTGFFIFAKGSSSENQDNQTQHTESMGPKPNPSCSWGGTKGQTQ